MQKLPLAVVILAAGKGKRMNSDTPKALHPLKEKPLLAYILETVRELTPNRIIIIIGHGAEQIQSVFGGDSSIEFVYQSEQLGTGHAVMQTKSVLDSFCGNVLVLCGDMPFIKPGTLKSMIECRTSKQAACVLLTLKTSESRDFGIVLRDSNGSISGIVEYKDANEKQKTIDEYNAGVYCFERSFLFQSIGGLNNLNAQSEYYLTDAVEYFSRLNLLVSNIQTQDSQEIFGVNSTEDLKKAECILTGFLS